MAVFYRVSMKSYSTSLMTNTYNVHTHIYTLIHTYTHTLIHSYTHTLIHTYTHTLIHTYTHTLIHTYTHTLIHSYTHTHIHSYTHTLIQSLTHIYSVRENYNNIILHVCLYMYIGGRSFRAHCTSDLMSLSLSHSQDCV